MDKENPELQMCLHPIGFVRSQMKERTDKRLKLTELFSEIEVDEKLSEALVGLKDFSHIIILYWMHLAHAETTNLTGHPMGNSEVPPQGLFALRAPNRPNPIGKATVRLLEIKGNVLKVQGLDAIDGTPVIDIKPYIPGYDSAANAKTPDWVIVEKEEL
jgi:tRNA-Thr(GGU) m(6)t(6)A37 methyltransferase TsaA